jgi:hypothetical protein
VIALLRAQPVAIDSVIGQIIDEKPILVLTRTFMIARLGEAKSISRISSSRDAPSDFGDRRESPCRPVPATSTSDPSGGHADIFTEAKKCALCYADQLHLDPTKIDAFFYAELKKHFTEPQIKKPGAFIAIHYGMQMVMHSLGAAAPRTPA